MAISVPSTHSGWVGHPAILTTGRPLRERKSAPSKPPARSSSYCRPQASDGLPPPAVMPPQAAQLPTATTSRARGASRRTQSIIGRPVPASTWKRPVPCGPRSSAPSMHSASSRTRPCRMSSSSASSSVPLASESEGCQSMWMPAERNCPWKSGVSAQSSDIEQPPQPPDCSHRTLSGCFTRPPCRSGASWRAGPRARVRGPWPRGSCCRGDA